MYQIFILISFSQNKTRLSTLFYTMNNKLYVIISNCLLKMAQVYVYACIACTYDTHILFVVVVVVLTDRLRNM